MLELHGPLQFEITYKMLAKASSRSVPQVLSNSFNGLSAGRHRFGVDHPLSIKGFKALGTEFTYKFELVFFSHGIKSTLGPGFKAKKVGLSFFKQARRY